MNNLNQIVPLQQDRVGVWRVPEEVKRQVQYIQPSEPTTAMSADTKAGLATAGLMLAAVAIFPMTTFIVTGIYGMMQIEGRRNQYKPKIKTEAERKEPSNLMIGCRKQSSEKHRKTTEVTQFTHIKTMEEHEFF